MRYLLPPVPPRLERARSGRWRWYATLLLAIGTGGPARAQATSDSTAKYEFMGFRPGMPRNAVDTAARQAGADSVHCERSRVDPRLAECRASLSNADAGRTVDLWLSAVNDTASILTLSAPLTASRLDRWREYLEGRYGPPSLRRIRGAITMAQWVHDRRMLRLTWRAKGRNFEASVSMVDGRVLDAWGNEKTKNGP